MDTVAVAEIEAKFGRIGARVRVRPARQPRLALDVVRDRRGELFELAVPAGADVEVLDTERTLRQLVLLARLDGEKPRFLCGHDERHWFVAAIPEASPVTTVEAAHASLRPEAIRDAASRAGRRAVRRRRTSDWVRQGEWFFVPAPDFAPDPADFVLRNEPITRSGGGTPHLAEEVVRTGGVTVHVPIIHGGGLTRAQRNDLARRFGRGLTDDEMSRVARANPTWRWSSMIRDPELYARGAVRHSDHATVTLHGWHRVLMNMEPQARAMAHVAFLD